MSVTRARIVIVDDHPIFRIGLEVLVRREVDLDLVADATTSASAVELAEQVRFDVALVDAGTSVVEDLYRIQPACKVIVVSVIDEPVRIADMMRVDAAGYVLKTQPIEELLEAIRMVVHGGRYLPPTISSAEVEALSHNGARPFDLLSAREREVFAFLMRGESNDDIATALTISRRTVETHRQRILKKMQAHSIVELFRIASRYGLFGRGDLHRHMEAPS